MQSRAVCSNTRTNSQLTLPSLEVRTPAPSAGCAAGWIAASRGSGPAPRTAGTKDANSKRSEPDAECAALAPAFVHRPRATGSVSLLRRKLSQIAARLAEHSRLRHFHTRPWVADNRPVFLLINHRCGGGTERHIGDLEYALKNEGVRPIVVRPSQAGRILWEERDDRRETLWCRESNVDRESIAEMLGAIAPVHAHVHHALGLPESLFDALAARGVSYDWTIHDYHTICPRINLISSGGRYCGEPDEAGCNRCLAQLGDDCGRRVTESIASWRERYARRLAGARRVFVPSTDVASRLGRYFPGLELTLRPHEESLTIVQEVARPLRGDEAIRVALIGTLVAVKGSERLLACASTPACAGCRSSFT